MNKNNFESILLTTPSVVQSCVITTTFAHSSFEGSPSKEGFHGTHGTPSRTATGSPNLGSSVDSLPGIRLQTP